MSRRILIGGSFGMGNTGDEAILQAMVEGLRARDPELHIQVIAGNAERIRRSFFVDAVAWDSWADIFEVAKRADLLIQGGGGIFFDYGDFDPASLFRNGAPNLNHYGSFSLMAALLDKRFMVFACGAGPLHTERGREMVRVAFSLADSATVRDKDSKALLQGIGVNVSDLEVTADPAFLLGAPDVMTGRDYLEAHGAVRGKPLIGLVTRQWDEYVGPIDWCSKLAIGLTDFAREIEAQVVLIPFQPGYDNDVQEVLSHLLRQHSPIVVPHDSNPSLVAGMISNCSLIVGMRLHSVLFAIMGGIPVVGLEYAPKVRSLMKRVGHEELCLALPDLAGLDTALRSAWKDRDQIRQEFSLASGNLKNDAERNLSLAMELLDSEQASRASRPAVLRMFAHAFEGRLNEIRRYEYAMDKIIPQIAL